MEVNQQITVFQDFLETHYKAELFENVREGKQFLVVDFQELSKFNPEIAQLLIDNPEELVKAFELSVRNFDLPSDVKNFRIRITNLPQQQRILIRNIRSPILGKFVWTEGVVRQKSDVRPHVTSARFECPSCGNVIPVLQTDTKFREPPRCGCGRKGKFRLLSKELVDAQGLVLEELAEDLEGGAQPKRINVFLQGDLVSPMTDKKTNPGTNIRVDGIIKEIPIVLRSGGQSTKFDLLLEANFVQSIEEDYSNIEISQEEEEEILKIANSPDVIEKLAGSLAPNIYGHDQIKEALIMQFVGGVSKLAGGVHKRGDIHMLLIGDPGAGKSQLLKRASIVAPKSRYVSGKGVSGAGLTAAVVKDEFLGGWSLEAGALVLSHKGVLMIDEMDKMTPEDRSAMHEGLEQQTISISKANIQATLRCETTVLAAANPKFGRFDPYETINKQIDLPPALINRFDLIFVIKDMPNAEVDEKIARFILSMHKEKDTKEPPVNTELLRKYLIYARQKIEPEFTEEAVEKLQDYYVRMRSSGAGEDGSIKAIPISARQLDALVRLSEASAKLKLSKQVTKDDAEKAIFLLQYCLQQVGVDPETGKLDIDRISVGITSSERNKIAVVREIINELEETEGKSIPLEEVVRLAKEKGLTENAIEESIEKLKRSGDIFSPKPNLIQKI